MRTRPKAPTRGRKTPKSPFNKAFFQKPSGERLVILKQAVADKKKELRYAKK